MSYGKTVKIVIGAVFGDEGKGHMTNYFCQQFPNSEVVVNVRHNGGAQAGHTVVSNDGTRHIFSHFGAGSLNNNVITYLSQFFIVNPLVFMREFESLNKIGITPKVYIHKDAIISYPCDMLINQITDKVNNEHCSCGLGIYETQFRNTKPEHKMTIGEIIELTDDEIFNIINKANTYSKKRLYDLSISGKCDLEQYIDNDNIVTNYIKQLKEMLSHCNIVNSDIDIFSNYDNFVFEGAQGLLLSTDNVLYHPHLTSTHTGIKNAIYMLEHYMQYIDALDEFVPINIEICYVTRSYFTRHGDGRFDTECEKHEILSNNICEWTNIYNEFQGKFRYGYYDVDIIDKEIEFDLGFINCTDLQYKISLAVTHLDESNGVLLCDTYPATDLHTLDNLYCIYESYGDKVNDIICSSNTGIKSYYEKSDYDF